MTHRPDGARPWARAATLADLGALTARWLENDLAYHPGLPGPPGPDLTATPSLMQALTALNRRGAVSLEAQPGEALTIARPGGHDSYQCHRPFAELLLPPGKASDIFLAELRDMTEPHYLYLAVHTPPTPRWFPRRTPTLPVSWLDSEVLRETGAQRSRRELYAFFRPASGPALAQAADSIQLTAADTRPGSNELWPLLEHLADTYLPAAA